MRMGRGEWSRLAEIADELERRDDDGAVVLAGIYRSVLALADSDREEARAHFETAKERLDEGDLPGAFQRPQLIPQAVLGVLWDDPEALENALEEFADDTNPHVWVRAHWNLDALARLLAANGQHERVVEVGRVLFEHDPHYAGAERWLSELGAEQ